MAYRSIYSDIQRDPEFVELSPQAKLLVYTLKVRMGPLGIEVLQAGELTDLTGLEYAQVTAALDELQDADWIRREANVIWLRNGLRHEPGFKPEKNLKHRSKAEADLAKLPRKLLIVAAFREYYGIDGEMPTPEGKSKTKAAKSRSAPKQKPLKAPSTREVRPKRVDPVGPERKGQPEPPVRKAEKTDVLHAARSRLMGLVREKLHNGTTNGSGAADASILTTMLNKDFPEDGIREAILGARILRDRGEIPHIEPGEYMSLRALHAKETTETWQRAREAYKAAEREKAMDDPRVTELLS